MLRSLSTQGLHKVHREGTRLRKEIKQILMPYGSILCSCPCHIIFASSHLLEVMQRIYLSLICMSHVTCRFYSEMLNVQEPISFAFIIETCTGFLMFLRHDHILVPLLTDFVSSKNRFQAFTKRFGQAQIKAWLLTV